MKNHLKALSFCNFRRINPFQSYRRDLVAAWGEERTWYLLGDVNVFIGANGAGKSTILELVETIAIPQRMATLARENQTQHSASMVQMIFGSGAMIFAKVRPSRDDGMDSGSNVDSSGNPFDSQGAELLVKDSAGSVHTFKRNISKREIDSESVRDIVSVISSAEVKVCSFVPSMLPNAEDMVMELNAARTHLGGILSTAEMMGPLDDYGPEGEDDSEISRAVLKQKQAEPFELLDDGRIAVYLSDDIDQSNIVQIAALPAGWRHMADLVGWLRNCDRGAICLIEEPENHLHPRLQRYLAQRMDLIADERELQLMIATHSPVFQQPASWPGGANVFQARAGVLSKLDSAWRVLDDLGIRGADVSQSNGVIWIEGPSDRLYIKHWLRLYCTGVATPEPVENRDYSFCMYGGANLSHFSVAEQEAFIDMVCINRNMVIVIDRDKDFAPGTTECATRNSAKYRVIEELKSRELPKAYTWVTDGYTIESYLPIHFQAKYFEVKRERLILKKNKSKVDAARRHIQRHSSWRGYSHLKELKQHIEQLHQLICSWDI